jgi:hypothetical protein
MLLFILLIIKKLQHSRLLAHGQQQVRKFARRFLPDGIEQG